MFSFPCFLFWGVCYILDSYFDLLLLRITFYSLAWRKGIRDHGKYHLSGKNAVWYPSRLAGIRTLTIKGENFDDEGKVFHKS